MKNQSDLIPVTLLTGFLGSGKTTVLNHLIAQPELSDALVIVNEFGEVGIDHMLVAHSAEVAVAQLSSGCMCCTIRSDLVKTLRDVTWRFAREGKRQFSRVVIETTGLADPAPIINTLMTNPQITSKYKLDAIVTTVDMVNGPDTLAKHDEAIKQVALADMLLLTKADLITNDQQAALEQQLDAINALAPRLKVSNGAISPDKIINLELGAAAELRFGLVEMDDHNAHGHDEHHEHHHHDHDHEHDHHHHHDHLHHHAKDGGINAYCFSSDEPVAADVFDRWLGVLEGFMGEKILRVKGVLNVSGRELPVVVHGVQHLLHPVTELRSETQTDPQSNFVFITQDVSRQEIEDAFADFPGVIPSATNQTK